MTILLQASLNGDRDHPSTPRTPDQLAAEAREAVSAGASVLHFHPYDAHSRETFAPDACAAAIQAVRAACPGIPISLSTADRIESNLELRHAQIAAWTELPDLVTANQGQIGIFELCELLLAKGIGIEAGLLSVADTHAFIVSGLAPHCVRVLLEPLDIDPDTAMAHAAAMEELLAEAGIGLEQVHHGEGIASWAVNRRALNRGHGIRTGLEDTAVLPDGRPTTGNGELVAAALELIKTHRREEKDAIHP